MCVYINLEYPLLLREIVKNTSSIKEDYAIVHNAWKKIAEVVTFINDVKKGRMILEEIPIEKQQV